jgi:arylsulfatase A-like enzyme
MHVVDIMPTLVDFAGSDASSSSPHPLDGVSQVKLLTEGAPSARTDVLINIERSHATTAASPDGKCDGPPQYAVISGRYKLLLGGGGQPNTWYHDDLPYKGSDPVPEGGCIKACSASSPTG